MPGEQGFGDYDEIMQSGTKEFGHTPIARLSEVALSALYFAITTVPVLLDHDCSKLRKVYDTFMRLPLDHSSNNLQLRARPVRVKRFWPTSLDLLG